MKRPRPAPRLASPASPRTAASANAGAPRARRASRAFFSCLMPSSRPYSTPPTPPLPFFCNTILPSCAQGCAHAAARPHRLHPRWHRQARALLCLRARGWRSALWACISCATSQATARSCCPSRRTSTRCVVGTHTRRIAEHTFLADVALSYPQVFDSELCWLVLFTSLHALDEEDEAKRRFLLVPHYNKTFVTFATSTVEEQPDIAAELGVNVSNIPRVCE